MRNHRTDTTSNESSARTSLMVMAGGMLMLTLAASSALAGEDKPAEVSHDGLHLVPDTKVAAAYVKPDADLGAYGRVMILDTYVAFRKNWARDQNRSSIYKITNRDIEKIKQATAELFREVFVEELDTEGGYPVVDSPDTDVLLLRPAIIDLDVTAPDLDRAGRSYNFASSAGAATLYLELYDSVSGEILARVIDRKASSGHVMRWSNKVTNRVEAKRILAGWAGLLRDRLDELHGKK